jgi:hypothetical protein
MFIYFALVTGVEPALQRAPVGYAPVPKKGCSLRQAIFSSSAEIENSQEFFNLALAYSENWWL